MKRITLYSLAMIVLVLILLHTGIINEKQYAYIPIP